MATNVTLNSVSYSIPATGDSQWGTNVANYLIAISTAVLQKSGGAFTLTADVDFGASYGLKAVKFSSRSTPATVGVFRAGNNQSLAWRDAANAGDLELKVNASDVLEFDGAPLVTLALGTANYPLKMNAGATAYEWAQIIDASVAASAAIALTKLAATTVSRALVSDASGFVTASATTATEIGYVSGLTSAVQTQINTKITASSTDTLTNKSIDSDTNTISNIVNADIKSTAAIAFSKLATLTSANILVGSAGNVATSVAVTGDVSLSNAGVTAYSATVPIAKGGSGQTTAADSLKALVAFSAKGQLSGYDGSAVGLLTVGADGTVLTADAASTLGIKWSAPLINPMTTAEDIIYGGVSGAATRKAIGTANHVLKSSSTSTLEYGLLVNANIDAAAAIAITKINYAPGSLTDAQAASLGRKEYTAGTVTVTGTNSFVADDCFFIPYELQSGGWRLKFTITGTSSSATSVTITLADTTFYNMGGTNEGQACCAKTSANANTRAAANDAVGTILITCSSASTGWTVSGDCRLASKPTWVD